MRLVGIFICGVLLSVQGFAVKGYAGKNGMRQLKELLHNQPLMEQLSARLGGTLIGINSGNIGSKILAASAGLGLMFAVTTTDASSIEKRAQAADKKILSAKVVELGDGVKLDYGGRIGGSYSNSTGKPDNFSFGVELGGTLSRELSSLGVKGSFLSTRTKAVGADDYEGAEDWIGRATFVQAIPTASDNVKPIVYVEGGFSHYGDRKQAADGTGGIGVSASGTLFGKNVHLQLRGGFGWLGEGAYDRGADSYADIEGDTVGVFGATVKTEWTSAGDILQAADGSLLYYIPIIPAATTNYNEYRPLGGDGDFDDVTRRVESTLNILQGLGVTLKYDGKKGEEAAKSAQITYSYGF